MITSFERKGKKHYQHIIEQQQMHFDFMFLDHYCVSTLL